MGTMGALPFSAAVRRLRTILLANREMSIPNRNTPIVVAILCDIPHPGQGLVATFFDNLEVADLDT